LSLWERTKMRAAVYKGKQQLCIEEIPIPEPGPGQVLVKIKYCAICGTDVHGFLYDVVPPGMVMGHEWCGTIAQLGPGVTSWIEGERVLGGGGEPPVSNISPVRTDPRFNYRDFIETGFALGRLMAYAEYAVTEDWELTAILEGVTDEEATMCEPFYRSRALRPQL
jgi:threonine dehydrogenase-like Zn-dependent dehydrogenase